MLAYLDFKSINNTDSISKNCEATKTRMATQWHKITLNKQEDEFCERYSTTKGIIGKTLKDGKVSLRIVAALAKELSVNPYFITCDSDNFKEYSDETLHQFLLENGYDSDKPPKPGKPDENGADANGADKKSADTEDSADSTSTKDASNNGDVKEKEVEQRDAEQNVAHADPYIATLRARIEQKLISCSPSELGKIESISEKNALELLRSLYLRAEYDEEIKRIATIVKLAMLL